jgi:sec-independent protein translocase protein TatB
MLSIPHMLVVFVIVLVVFGPQKLPEFARSLGKLLAEFRKASTDFRSAFEEEMKDLERQAREVERKKAADAAARAAEEAPVQAATFATPAGTETPAMEAVVDPLASGEAQGAAVATESATADALGDPIDPRVTEGAAELVVTPVAEAVARTASSDYLAEPTEKVDEIAPADGATPDTPANGTGKSSASAPISRDVPHDQQPA